MPRSFSQDKLTKKTLSPSLFFLIQEVVHAKINNSTQMLRVWNPHCYKSKITGNIQELPEQTSWRCEGRKEKAKAGSSQELIWTQGLRRQCLFFIFGSTSWGRTTELCQVSLYTSYSDCETWPQLSPLDKSFLDSCELTSNGSNLFCLAKGSSSYDSEWRNVCF